MSAVPHQLRRSGGFTLLELVGVIAVLAILAGALAPSVVQMIDEGYRAAETENLQTISDGFVRYVRATKQIPSTVDSDWTVAVAQFAALAPGKVLQNPKNHDRRLYADQMFFTNVNSAFNGYTQDQGLSSAPFSPRLILASPLDGDVRVAIRLESGSEGSVGGAAGSVDGSRTVFVIADTRLGLNDAPYPGGATLRQTIVRSDYAARFQLDGTAWHWVD